jgi:predicted transcriptional regulator
MKVKLTAEMQAKLERLAAEQGRAAETLVHEAVERLIGYDKWFVREVDKGLAQIEADEVLEHDDIGARIEEVLSEEKERYS